MKYNNLWLVKPNPSGNNRINEFLQYNIIAIGWRDLQDMSNKSRKEIYEELEINNYNDSSSKSAFNYLINEMSINDLCIIIHPYKDIAYLGRIKSDYYFDDTKIEDGYSHQRKVEFLDKSDSIKKSDFNEEIIKSFKSHFSITNMKKKIKYMEDFLLSKEI